MNHILDFDIKRDVRLSQFEALFALGKVDRRGFLKAVQALGIGTLSAQVLADQTQANSAAQAYNSRNLRKTYDYIVCGAGSAGAVVARRLAEDSTVSVLLVEAGGADSAPSIVDPSVWFTNLGTERMWSFTAEPQSSTNDRSLPLPMGRVIGGGSSVNALIYARGHKSDYEQWASMTNDPRWGYANALSIFKRIEAWAGPVDMAFRGMSGILTSQPIMDPHPVARALVATGPAFGIPIVQDLNAATMESHSGIGHPNVKVKDGRRSNIPTDYLYPILSQPNLTVLTGAEVKRVLMREKTASGISFVWRGEEHSISVSKEIVLSMGAVNTPKVLMLSGIGHRQELASVGIPSTHHMAGVGKNLQDHPLAACVWEYKTPMPPRGTVSECTFFARTGSSGNTPDLIPVQIQVPFPSEVTGKQFSMPDSGWTLVAGLAHPKSRGSLRLRSKDPKDAPLIKANFLADPSDVKTLMRGVELMREMGNSEGMKDFVKREVMPGSLTGGVLEAYTRNAVGTYFHLSGTCKMGLASDPLAVVDSELRVIGVKGLRIADTSIIPAITTTNTMAPAVLIGERLGELLRASA